MNLLVLIISWKWSVAEVQPPVCREYTHGSETSCTQPVRTESTPGSKTSCTHSVCTESTPGSETSCTHPVCKESTPGSETSCTHPVGGSHSSSNFGVTFCTCLEISWPGDALLNESQILKCLSYHSLLPMSHTLYITVHKILWAQTLTYMRTIKSSVLRGQSFHSTGMPVEAT